MVMASLLAKVYSTTRSGKRVLLKTIRTEFAPSAAMLNDVSFFLATVANAVTEEMIRATKAGNLEDFEVDVYANGFESPTTLTIENPTTNRDNDGNEAAAIEGYVDCACNVDSVADVLCLLAATICE